MPSTKHTAGFTLIEVLVALTILSIALLALLSSTTTTLTHLQRLKHKNIAHWVMLQGIHTIQLGLLPLEKLPHTTYRTQLLGEQWYWRAELGSTPIATMQSIHIKAALRPEGPFTESYLGYYSRLSPNLH